LTLHPELIQLPQPLSAICSAFISFGFSNQPTFLAPGGFVAQGVIRLTGRALFDARASPQGE